MAPIAPPDPDDTLTVPHFEEGLLDRLHARQQAGSWGSGTRPRSRSRSGARRRPPVRLIVAAAAAGTVLLGGVATIRAMGDDGPDVDTTRTGVADDDSVRDRILAALDHALTDSVVHTTGDGIDESWVDLRSGAERNLRPAAGGRTLDWGRSVAPGIDDHRPSPTEAPTRIVDSCLRQYSDRQQPTLQVSDVITPMREELASGTLVVGGTAVVAGRELIRLTPDPSPTPTSTVLPPDIQLSTPSEAATGSAAARASQPIVYVDPTSYLPVVVDDAPTTNVSEPGSQLHLEFLPRTADTLALLVPPVPDGYTQVAAPALDEERAAACS